MAREASDQNLVVILHSTEIDPAKKGLFEWER